MQALTSKYLEKKKVFTRMHCRQSMYVENPFKGWKTTVWVRENHSCSVQLCVMWGIRVSLVQEWCSSSKERPCFLPYFLINFLLFSQKIYLGSYPNSLAAWSSYSLRNMLEYKDRCQVIIFLFWTLLQLRYYLVAGGERMPILGLWHR